MGKLTISIWSFSIVMLVYQRVNHYRMGPQFGIAKLVNITTITSWCMIFIAINLDGVVNQLITGGPTLYE